MSDDLPTASARSLDDLTEEERVNATYLAEAYYAFTGSKTSGKTARRVLAAANWLRAARVMGLAKWPAAPPSGGGESGN